MVHKSVEWGLLYKSNYITVRFLWSLLSFRRPLLSSPLLLTLNNYSESCKSNFLYPRSLTALETVRRLNCVSFLLNRVTLGWDGAQGNVICLSVSGLTVSWYFLIIISSQSCYQIFWRVSCFSSCPSPHTSLCRTLCVLFNVQPPSQPAEEWGDALQSSGLTRPALVQPTTWTMIVSPLSSSSTGVPHLHYYLSSLLQLHRCPSPPLLSW